jgi:CxxC-x17-CxxC domain-containing protein
MDFVDRNLICKDCGAEFLFTAGEQLFFHEKQFTNDPKRCKECKAKRDNRRMRGKRGPSVRNALPQQPFRLSPLMEHLSSAGHAFSRGKFQNYPEGRMDFVDKELKCIDCGAEFTFSAAEQLFFHDEQFKNDPKRCRQCRARLNSRPRKPLRPEATCAECGSGTTVPFTPNQGSPVLCRPCLQKNTVANRPRSASTRPVGQWPSSLCGNPIPGDEEEVFRLHVTDPQRRSTVQMHYIAMAFCGYARASAMSG